MTSSFRARRVHLVCRWIGAIAIVCFVMFPVVPDVVRLLIVPVGLTPGDAPALLLAAELSTPSTRGRALGQILAVDSLG